MNLKTHRLSSTVFSLLAAGAGGAEAVRELCAAQASKHRLLVRLLLEETGRTGHRDAGLVARAYEALSDMESRAPAEVGRCLRYPAVGAWALRACRAAREGGGDAGRLAAVALAAAIRTRTRCRLAVPVDGGTLMLPSLGLLALPAGTPNVVEAVLEPGQDSAELRLGPLSRRIDLRRDRPGWQVLHSVTLKPGLTVTIDDLDPYRWPAQDAERRLSGDRLRLWATSLREAWRILSTRHWTVAGETEVAVSVLTPLVRLTRDQRSASARDTFGTIAMSDPLDGLNLALTLAHELQHAKLDALTRLVELTRPDDGSRYYAPWRKDPRPVFGLLHGAYAHAGVAGFWRRHVEDPVVGLRAQAEYARWREAAHQVTGTLLDSGRLTEAGTLFVATLRDTLTGWRTEPVTPAAAARALQESERHREEWAGPSNGLG